PACSTAESSTITSAADIAGQYAGWGAAWQSLQLVPDQWADASSEVPALVGDQRRAQSRQEELLSHQVHHALLRLQVPAHPQQRGGLGQHRESVEDPLPHHYIHEAGLVLQ